MPAGSLVFLAILAFQYPYGVPRTPRLPGTATVPGGDTAAVATFQGTFKSASRKYLLIDTPEGNTMRMYITGSTKFFRDDRAVKRTDFHEGDKVTVDAERDQRMNLLAVRVAAVPEKKAPAGHPDESHESGSGKPASQ